MPINYLLVEAIHEYEKFYDPDFKIECPTGSGVYLGLAEVAKELTRRLTLLFRRGVDGRRAVFGACALFQNDPDFRDHIPFFEYFHGDTGAGTRRVSSDRLDGAGSSPSPIRDAHRSRPFSIAIDCVQLRDLRLLRLKWFGA